MNHLAEVRDRLLGVVSSLLACQKSLGVREELLRRRVLS